MHSIIVEKFSSMPVAYVWFQFQEERDDLQRKLAILQDDLEKSEARADSLRKEGEEKASALDETERSEFI